MKRMIFQLLPVLLLATTVLSANERAGRSGERRSPVKLAPQVYAPKNEVKQQSMTPEQRANFEAARKRRFEIMVLIGAYKIMPVDQRQALKQELLKRIEADFQSMMKMQKARIAKAEAELKRLRADLAEKEANADKLVERELDRLLKVKFPARRGLRQKANVPTGKAE